MQSFFMNQALLIKYKKEYHFQNRFTYLHLRSNVACFPKL